MYYVTLRHGSAFPFEIERLWSMLATHHKRNIIPVLDFLIGLGMGTALQVGRGGGAAPWPPRHACLSVRKYSVTVDDDAVDC